MSIPWCDRFNFQIKNIFTRLNLVAKEKTRGIETTKEVTNMTSIFAPHESCKKPLIVLIEGEPGMGKTTYCQKLVLDWASEQCGEWDESFPRIDVLLLLRCREIKSTIWEAIEEQVLPNKIKREEKTTFFRFLRENPSKVLLVLDGLDEADPQKLEMFLYLVQREQLPGCYIVLTSRHEAGSKEKWYADKLLEIVGFTTADAECYIRKYFQSAEYLAEDLISKVQLNEDLRELTRNPLNTLLLCVVFEDLEGILPTNRTQLYVEIVLFVLRRYKGKNGSSNNGKDLLLVYKTELMNLGETALDSLRKRELYIDDHKGYIKESLWLKFGFVSIQSGGSKRTPCNRYGFFHKCFQEFLSGYFLAFSVIDDVTNSRSVVTDERYMGELFHVFKFMSGIIALRSEETAVSVAKSIASIVNETGGTSDKFVSNLRFAHELINECKACSGNLSRNLDRTFGESLKLADVVARPSNFPRDSKCIETLFKALTFNSTVSRLNLFEWGLSIKVANLLAHALRENTSLSSLGLSFNSIGGDGQTSLARTLRVNSSLSYLNLCHTCIGDEGTKSLAQALRVNRSLSYLGLPNNSIGSEGADFLGLALRVNSSLSSLALCENSIGDEGADSLAWALRVNTSLLSLDLSKNLVGDEGADALAQALRKNTSLSSLYLLYNSIGDEGARSLAQALRENTSLSSLYLCYNSIGDEGALSTAQALTVNKSLSSLNLHSNTIYAEGANSFLQVLQRNLSLSHLDLSDSSIDDEGANSLAQGLRVSIHLSSLGLSDNKIGNEGATSFAMALKLNSSLSSLDLSSNFIGNKGANSLAQALRVNRSLSFLDLSSNYIGDEGANSLGEALKVNKSLSVLDLSSNFIGDEGVNSLGEALKVNRPLSSLGLSYNAIGFKGASSLILVYENRTSLTLDFSYNSVGPEGMNLLAQYLREKNCFPPFSLRYIVED